MPTVEQTLARKLRAERILELPVPDSSRMEKDDDDVLRAAQYRAEKIARYAGVEAEVELVRNDDDKPVKIRIVAV